LAGLIGGPPPNRELVTLATFAMVAQTTGQPAGRNVGAPQSLTPAVALVVRADDNNQATINWGMGNAGDPLAKGETVAVDLPPGYFLDLSQLVISGTAGDQIHITAAIIQSAPVP
jgi:hypothetical protein